MKVLAIVGSPRKSGNTATLVQYASKGIESESIECTTIYLQDINFKGCIGCEGCAKSSQCVIQDGMQEIYPLLDECDALILASPTYFYNISSLTKAFIERLYCYENFDEFARNVWVPTFETGPIKYALTIAVCEQDNEDDMGMTSSAMSLALESLGFRCTDNLKILHAFKQNDIASDEKQKQRAFDAGIKLAKTLKLRNKLMTKGE